jgi:hypothetical protein
VIAVSLLVIAGSLYVIVAVPPGGAKVRRFCDQQVATLLTTKEQLELDRARFLVRWLDCSVSRRLP